MSQCGEGDEPAPEGRGKRYELELEPEDGVDEPEALAPAEAPLVEADEVELLSPEPPLSLDALDPPEPPEPPEPELLEDDA